MDRSESMKEMQAAWSRVQQESEAQRIEQRAETIDRWQTQMAELKRERNDLLLAGKWVSGPIHFLAVIGKERWETYHSAFVAWLLDPLAHHGLGTTFLRRFLGAIGVDETLDDEDLRKVVPETERTVVETRADIVLSSPRVTVVVETKVDAQEHPKQCDRLFREWTEYEEARSDPAFVFLTPTGMPPETATGEALQAFQPLGFDAVHSMLLEAMQDESSGVEPRARSAVEAYVDTLEWEFGMGSEAKGELAPAVVFFLEHKDLIEEWAQLRKRETAAAIDFYEGLAGRLANDVDDLPSTPFVYTGFNEPSRKIFLHRERWTGKDGRPKLATGLEWYQPHGFDYHYLGVWVDQRQLGGEELSEAVSERLIAEGVDRGTPNRWWPAQDKTSPDERFWEHLPELEIDLIRRIKADWERFHRLLDEVYDNHL